MQRAGGGRAWRIPGCHLLLMYISCAKRGMCAACCSRASWLSLCVVHHLQQLPASAAMLGLPSSPALCTCWTRALLRQGMCPS